MAGSVNKVILVGNLGRDPEVRNSQGGNKIVQLSIATSESWKDRQSGERREKIEWHRVVIFNPHLAELAEKYLRKGSKAYLEGQLQTRKWTDQSGVEKYTTEIVISKFKGELTLLDGRGDGQGGNGGGAQGGGYDQSPQGDHNRYGTGYSGGGRPAGGGRPHTGASWEPPPDLDDEIPF